jgi:hypothetical protein
MTSDLSTPHENHESYSCLHIHEVWCITRCGEIFHGARPPLITSERSISRLRHFMGKFTVSFPVSALNTASQPSTHSPQ